MSITILILAILCLKGKITADVLSYLVIVYSCLEIIAAFIRNYEKQKGTKQ